METIIEKLARHCALAMEGVTGKKRDRATIDYWNGAIGAMHSVGHEHSDWVSRVGWLLVRTRGYSEIERIIAKADERRSGDET